jgi:hypothetical protein
MTKKYMRLSTATRPVSRTGWPKQKDNRLANLMPYTLSFKPESQCCDDLLFFETNILHPPQSSPDRQCRAAVEYGYATAAMFPSPRARWSVL